MRSSPNEKLSMKTGPMNLMAATALAVIFG
jgi:hypothetical protein